MKHFQHRWPSVRGVHRSTMRSSKKTVLMRSCDACTKLLKLCRLSSCRWFEAVTFMRRHYDATIKFGLYRHIAITAATCGVWLQWRHWTLRGQNKKNYLFGLPRVTFSDKISMSWHTTGDETLSHVCATVAKRTEWRPRNINNNYTLN